MCGNGIKRNYLNIKVEKVKTEIKEEGLTIIHNESSTNFVSAKGKDEIKRNRKSF